MMTGSRILSVLVIGFLCTSAFAQAANVRIYGKNKEYAGKELDFFVYTERIFNSYESVAITKVDSSGNFSVSFLSDVTQSIYCQTPLYTAYIYAEPGKSYHVDLPPSTGMSAENRNNPFFIPPLWHMLPLPEQSGATELNAAIDSFNKQFDPFLDKQLLLYYNPQHHSEKLDSFILASGNLPKPANPEYYQSYCLYKMASISFMVNQFNYADLYEKYIKTKPVLSDVPSWWEFFNLYFDGYFSSLSAKKEYSELYNLIGKGKYTDLKQLLKNDPALQDDKLREWSILKEIQKAYYQNGLPLSTLISICDSLSIDSSNKLSISLSEIIKKEASSLIVGNSPPAAILMNTAGDSLELSDLKGKYSYIGFNSLDNLGCQKEFEYLKYLYHKHGKFLELIIVLPDSEKDRIPSFTYENSIPWTFWYTLNTNSTLKDYKVKAYPVFYLFDRNGKLFMSPATLPSAGFEQQLFYILKGKKEI